MRTKIYPQFNFYKNTKFNDQNVDQYLDDYFICVNSSGHIHSVPHFKQSHANVLNLYFDDTERNKIKVTGNLVYYAIACTEKQAKTIKEFIDTIPESATVHIYCAKGKSRSTAIGKFIEDYKNIFPKTEFNSYNSYVYNLLWTI